MIIMGIDPGIALVGYGVISFDGNTLRVLEYGCIDTPAHMPIPERLVIIDRELEAIIRRYRPEEVAFEELFFYQNKTTGIMVAQARGVEVLACRKFGLALYEYTPSQIKQAVCGYGKAAKLQVQSAVQMLLRLSELPKPDDAADGLAVAICHAFGQRFKTTNEMR
ncbi:MAG: crossover junction endodeoxyribonuclease RuvC [Ndongobacter sp.]|nr:crossover junction endodeoxyribonuclease RuvC [Ndongobacter sp.]